MHTDTDEGDVRLTLIGTNEAGLSLNFAPGTETVINAEFKASPQEDGTLVTIEESLPDSDSNNEVIEDLPVADTPEWSDENSEENFDNLEEDNLEENNSEEDNLEEEI